MNVFIKKTEFKKLEEVLIEKGFSIKEEKGVLFLQLSDFNTYIVIVENKGSLYFELDLIGINKIDEKIDFYKELLYLNTEILPISLGINSLEGTSNRLVLVESLSTENLDENEVLEVLDTIEINLPRILKLIDKYIK